MNIDRYLDILKKVSIFNSYDDDTIKTLFSGCSFFIRDYSRDSFLHMESELCQTCDIVLQGNIQVQQIGADGDILTIANYTEGDIFGLNLLFSSNPKYPMNIYAKTDSVVLHLRKDFILNLCKNDDDFLLSLLTCLSDKSTLLTQRIKTISQKSARKLVIDFLQKESQKTSSNNVKLTMTKKELAQFLGIQRTSLSRELQKMRKEGLIDYDSRYIYIKKKI